MSRSAWRLVPLAVVPLCAVLAEPARAAVSVSRAELDGTRLRLEGRALADRDVTVDGVVLGRSDAEGAFRIQRTATRPPRTARSTSATARAP